jgi:hypothetical protein
MNYCTNYRAWLLLSSTIFFEFFNLIVLYVCVIYKSISQIEGAAKIECRLLLDGQLDARKLSSFVQ